MHANQATIDTGRDPTAPRMQLETLLVCDIVDSTGVLELVAFIEDSFGISMADGDVVPANLDTIERIAAFVSARAAAAVAAE